MYFGYGYGFGYGYIFIIIGLVICGIASAKMRSTFQTYSRIRSTAGMTGAQAAERILHNAGIYDVAVGHVSGNLTDHYDPRTKTLNLSDSIYNQTSVAAVGVAAHECGHAIQHAKGYVPLQIRGAIVPVVNIGSKLAWPLIIIGLMFRSQSGTILLQIGIILFSLAVLFQLITLPVEFDASHRAMKQLESNGILHDSELGQARKVLTAAAMTYVAATISIFLQLLRLILISNSRR